jgi:hypothetical protein
MLLRHSTKCRLRNNVIYYHPAGLLVCLYAVLCWYAGMLVLYAGWLAGWLVAGWWLVAAKRYDGHDDMVIQLLLHLAKE